jgi:hypothetical protein
MPPAMEGVWAQTECRQETGQLGTNLPSVPRAVAFFLRAANRLPTAASNQVPRQTGFPGDAAQEG